MKNLLKFEQKTIDRNDQKVISGGWYTAREKRLYNKGRYAVQLFTYNINPSEDCRPLDREHRGKLQARHNRLQNPTHRYFFRIGINNKWNEVGCHRFSGISRC